MYNEDFKILYYVIFYNIYSLFSWCILKVIIFRDFCKYDSKLKVKHKTNSYFLGTLIYPIHPQSLKYSRKCHYFLFFFLLKNEYFTLSFSYSSSIYNIVIAINTPTIMNNQFECLNAPKIRFCLLPSHFL